MALQEVYFWTDTIMGWKRLLKQDKYKEMIISSWRELVSRGKISVYAFVIMPNHLHVVWEMKAKNGREMPHASFNKFSSHMMLKDLKEHHPKVLAHFKVEEAERAYRIWQRDSLAIQMDSKHKVEQKIEYLHNNPLHERWKLADRPEKYRWSSAKFYETGKDDFGFITHYADRF